MTAEGPALLVTIRALLAVAESSPFPAEAAAFASKAQRLAARHGVDPTLLRFPRESFELAVIVAELDRLRDALERYDGDAGAWATKTAEWSACLDDYDVVLEAAAELLHISIPRLPFGCRRHFRPEERAEIEDLLERKVTVR